MVWFKQKKSAEILCVMNLLSCFLFPHLIFLGDELLEISGNNIKGHVDKDFKGSILYLLH